MSKKSFFITIIGVALLLTGITGWQLRTFSEEPRPFELECIGQSEGSDYCCEAYHSAIGNLKTAWSNNLENLMDQEKPASDMVDEAFENMRTYRCWLEYTCRAVRFSGHNTPAVGETGSARLTSKEIGTVPGCQDPEDLELSDTWSTFVDHIEKDWNFFKSMASGPEYSTLEVDMDLPASWFVRNGIGFIPQCMTDVLHKNDEPRFTEAQENYDKCIEIVDSAFGCQPGTENCNSPEMAFIQLTTALKKAQGDQKARALENKLSTIINRMHGMEAHVEYMKTKLQSIDSRYACTPAKCD